jgi:threonine dehydratase
MDITDIEKASADIKPYIKRTALEKSQTLSEYLGTNVYVKLEVFQKTGSFKVRGAFNKLLSLSGEEKKKGVVAVSGGNHAQAVAYASKLLGIEPVIIMPESTPRNYVDATRNYDAEIVFKQAIDECFSEVESYKSKGRTPVHPFDDSLVMAGQGTLGLEILEDLPETTDVFVSIGGGGLAGGVATAIKARKPEVRIWGVETVGAEAMSEAFKAGEPVEVKNTSIARTLSAPYVSDDTLKLAQMYLEQVIVVSDDEAVKELRFMLERLKILTEPAASCTLAAAARLKNRFNKDNHLVLILCGGNFSLNDLCSYNSGKSKN